MKSSYRVVAIGVSAGGLHALTTIVGSLRKDYPMAVIIVQHRADDSDDFLTTHLDQQGELCVVEACHGDVILPGKVFVAPAGYHLLVEMDGTLSLSLEPPVNYSRPSIDLLFESAAVAYREKLVGVILTGANSDGALGLRTIQQYGGLTIVQDPTTAYATEMPSAALDVMKVDHVIDIDNMGGFLGSIYDQ